jgi:hypothetical protein
MGEVKKMRRLKGKKNKCEKCGRLYRTRNLREHRVTKEIWCRICLKKYGENPFYIPQIKKGGKVDMIKTYGMTRQEAQMRYKEYLRRGLSPDEAGRKLAIHLSIMKNLQLRRRQSQINKQKFLEGLK